MLSLLAFGQSLDLPFPHTAIPFIQTEAGYTDVTKVDSWHHILLSDDGDFMVYRDNRYRWLDLPSGKWSSDEALVVEMKPPVRVYTVSQDFHIPRSATRRILLGSVAVAAYRDHSMALIAPLDVYREPFTYASWVRFDARGKEPNTMLKLRPVLRNAYSSLGILKGQDEDPSRVQVLGFERRGGGLRVTSVILRKDARGIVATYGTPFDLPATPPGSNVAPADQRPPFLLDIKLRTALYNASESSHGGTVVHPALAEYSLRSRVWRSVAPPEGYSPEKGTDGFFYWRGRLFVSPQPAWSAKIEPQPGTTPKKELSGLYEAQADGKGWKRISACTVLALSPAKRAWLVRDPQGRCWVARMR